MAAAYERFEGEVTANDEDEISSASEDTQSIDRVQQQLLFYGEGQIQHDHEDGVVDDPDRLRRVHELLQNKWPYKIGALHICWGILLSLLGVCQLFVMPLIEDRGEMSAYWKPSIDKTNSYGVTMWAALLLLLSGTLGVRAALYRNTCDLYGFVTVIMLDVLVFIGFTILTVVSFSSHWITRETFQDGSIQYPLSIAAAVCVVIGLPITLVAFVQYYEEVLCGELQLCRRCVHCCLPCFCPRTVNQDELLEEVRSERPPSLPV